MYVFEPLCIIVTLCGLEKSQFKLLTTAECPFSFSNVEYSYYFVSLLASWIRISI